MAIYRGQNVRIDYSDLELTEELEEALAETRFRLDSLHLVVVEN